MTFRDKSAIATVVTFLATAVVFFTYISWAMNRQASSIETLVAMVVILGAANGLFYAFIRTIRCPNCGIRFGSKMYTNGFVRFPWPRKECWNCGANMSEVEARQGPYSSNAPSPILKPARSSFPVRWQAILFFVVMWNGIIFADPTVLKDVLSGWPPQFSNFPGWSWPAAVLFAFAFAWATKNSNAVQKLVLQQGRSVEEIRPLLDLLQAISGLMLVGFAVFIAARAL